MIVSGKVILSFIKKKLPLSIAEKKNFFKICMENFKASDRVKDLKNTLNFYLDRICLESNLFNIPEF